MKRNRWSVDIGRVAGVRIRVHASFLLLFVLVWLSGVSTVEGALAETGWILAIFACVVVHELAHSVTATRLGIKVKDIVLFPLGGMSEMERLPDAPKEELAVAGSGPAASLVLAGLFLAACALLSEQWWPPTLLGGPVLARLVWVNALLAGFNLLPVLPMDGGRILRALLEPRLGRTGSTTAAAKVGMVGGAAFIAVGLLYDLWLVLIGVFILFAARMEGADAEVHRQLSVLPVHAAMMPGPWTLEADARVDPRWLDHVLARQGVLPVTHNELYLGVIGPAERAILTLDRAVGDLADRDAAVVGPDEPLDHALDLIQQGAQPAVVVVGAGQHVIGIVTSERLRAVLSGTARNGG